MTSLVQEILRQFKSEGLIEDEIAALNFHESLLGQAWARIIETTTSQVPSFSERLLALVAAERERIWSERVAAVNWELFDIAAATFPRIATEEILRSAKSSGLTMYAKRRREAEAFVEASINGQLGHSIESAAILPFDTIVESANQRFPKEVFLWRR